MFIAIADSRLNLGSLRDTVGSIVFLRTKDIAWNPDRRQAHPGFSFQP